MRYQLINAMMNPVTTVSEKGFVRVNGMSKTAAIKKLAESERQKPGKAISDREIYRSLKWVDDFLGKINAQLE